jgi:hypothetical protein
MCDLNTKSCLHGKQNRKRVSLLPQCCYDNMTMLLKNIAIVLNKNEIHWWLDWGSLLGIVRGGALTPYDGDLDIGIFKKDQWKFKDQPAKDFAEIGHYLCPHTCAGWNLHRSGHPRILFSKINRLYCDVNMWTINESGIAWGAGSANKCDAEFYTKLETIDFQGVPLKVPCRTEEYLALRYGETWRTPDPHFYTRSKGHKIRYNQYLKYLAEKAERQKQEKGP